MDDEVEHNVTLVELAARGVPLKQLSLKIPISLLREHREDAVMLLRFAAATNSVSAVSHILSRWNDLHPHKESYDFRDFFQLVAIGGALLCEAIRLLRKYGDRPWELARLALDRDYYEFDEPGLKRRFDEGPDSVYSRFLARWRDKLSFHWDPEPFGEYVDTVDSTESELWRWPPESLRLRFQAFSPAAVSILLKDLSGFPDNIQGGREAMKEIVQAQCDIRLLFEAALFGFLLEKGIDPVTLMTPPLKYIR